MTKMFATRFAQFCFLSASPLAFAVSAVPAAAQSQARTFDIPAQPLASAVLEFSRQADVMVVLPPELASGKRSAAVKGSLSVNSAIAQLLRRTGLRAVPNSAGGYRVAPFAENRAAARADNSKSSSSGGDGEASSEIVVTAQKRKERLQDVPVPVSAINAQALADNNNVRVQDFYTRVPGLNVTTTGYGPPVVSIRGITTAGLGINATVGLVVDDVPMGPSMREAFGPEAPEMDPSDLARVEVLRGPQGTLYGASSIGGLIKYVTIDPSTAAFKADISAGLTSVENGDGLGYSLRGAVNVPVNENFALRASAFGRRDTGYIDDPRHFRKGVNSGEAIGGQLSAFWRLSDQTTVRLGAWLQDTKRDGSSEVNVGIGLGDLEQTKIPGSGVYRKKFQLYSATINSKLGGVDLTSVTGYSDTKKFTSADNSTSAFFSAQSQTRFGVSGFEFNNDVHTRKFSQEIRASADIGSFLTVLVGGYYSNENNDLIQNWYAKDFNTGRIAGQWYHAEGDLDFEEYAIFADVTIKFSDRFDVQVGGRQGHNTKTLETLRSGPYLTDILRAPPLVPRIKSSESAFTYLVTPRFRISRDLMIYGRVASGYRPGGPNVNCVALGIPCSYDRDTTVNYEIGVKGSAFDRAVSFDASLYRIDWKDIQILIFGPVAAAGAFTTNGGKARSQGAELSIDSRPWEGAKISGWTSYNDAKLTQAFPPGAASLTYGVRGTRLPFSARWSGSISVEQEFPLSDRLRAFVSGTGSYVGQRFSIFAANATARRQSFPSYERYDLSAGLRADSWSLNLYVNNLADKRGVLYGGLGNFDPTGFTYIQPRTFGLTFSTRID